MFSVFSIVVIGGILLWAEFLFVGGGIRLEQDFFAFASGFNN